MRAFLSESLVSRVKAKRIERVDIRDTKITGFCLRVGKRRLVWCWHGQINNKAHRQSFGIWPAVSADTARQQCLTWLQSRGQSVYCSTPAPVRGCPTLLEAYQQYITHKQLRATTLKTYGKQMRLYLHTLHDKRLDSITSHDTRKLYADLCKSTSAAKANGTFGLFKAIYNWASAVHELALPDIFRVLVVSGEKQATPTRDDVLVESQIALLGQAIPNLFVQHQQFIQLGLMTGFRVGELALLSPSCIDFQSKTITLHTTKNGRKHVLPLSDALAVVIRPMCEGKAPTAPLFSQGIRNNASIISRATGVAFSAHTMRRTFASHATRLGITAYIVKALLNHHSTSDVTQAHYIKLQVDDLREPMEQISNHFAKLLGI